MKTPLTYFYRLARIATQYPKFYPIRFTLSIIGTFLLFLSGSVMLNAQDECDINNGWWDAKYLTLKSGLEDGDTVHMNSCQVPWGISPTDLEYYEYLKYRQCRRELCKICEGPIIEVRDRLNGYYPKYRRSCTKIKTFCYIMDLPDDAPEGMYQLWKYEYIVEDVYCYRKYKLTFYVGLYDNGAPVYQCFPADTTVASPADLPPVDEKVQIIDFCQYVDWWNVETTAVVDTVSGDTTCFVRTWSAGDPSGNESSKEQKIWISSDTVGVDSLSQMVSRSHARHGDWSVYPNPAKNRIYVSIQSDEEINYTLFDGLGRSVRHGVYYQGQAIPVEKLSPGIYHLQMRSNNDFIGAKQIILME